MLAYMLTLCDNTGFMMSISLLYIAFLKKYIFQNNLGDVKHVIFSVKDLDKILCIANKAWTVSDQICKKMFLKVSLYQRCFC